MNHTTIIASVLQAAIDEITPDAQGKVAKVLTEDEAKIMASLLNAFVDLQESKKDNP